MRVTEYHSEYYGMSVTEVARIILSKHNRVCADAVKELRDATGHSLLECKDLLMELQRQKRMEHLESENAKLRKLITNIHEALSADKLGMFHELILASMEDDMRELGIEVS